MLEALANVANSKMPASLSGNISSKDQQQQQQQQQSSSLQYSNSSNSIKTTSIVIDSLLTSTSSNATTTTTSNNNNNSNNSLQNESTSLNKMKLIINNNSNKLDTDLINNKFNELAKKILEELKQTQYSKEFFKTIDEIIKEPSSKSIGASNYASRRAKYLEKYQQLLNSQQQQIVQQQQQLQLLSSKEKLQTKASQTDHQSRSLPVDVSISLQQQQQQLLTAHHRTDLNSKRCASSKNNADQADIVSNGQTSRVSNTTSPNRSNYQSSQNSYPLSRSATAVESMQNSVKRQQQQQQQAIHRKQSSSVVSSPNQDNCENNNSSNNSQYLYRRHKNYSAGSVLNKRSSIGNHNSYDDSDDDIEDEDDDDDDDDDDNDGHSISPANQSRGNYQNSRFNPISKSKTLSDTTNISEINMLTKQQHSPRQHQQQQQQYLQPNQKQQPQRFIKSTVLSNINNVQQQDQHSEPKSMVLNSKDIGSLYKPHMNYSTSVLGNHRLSDDDEIIIIPTQSPSLVSNSPDPDPANADELTERFSISRTKSFWEKLSKGTHGKRANQVSRSSDASSLKAPNQIALNNNNNSDHNNIDHNHYNQIQPQQQQQHQQQQQYNINGNKIIGVRLNGHSHTLDRMDSTGGSNSNYSCSSSGDENGVGSHSQQNPAISQQEMSRQNRLRQTR